jgi:hypothetical protein
MFHKLLFAALCALALPLTSVHAGVRLGIGIGIGWPFYAPAPYYYAPYYGPYYYPYPPVYPPGYTVPAPAYPQSGQTPYYTQLQNQMSTVPQQAPGSFPPQSQMNTQPVPPSTLPPQPERLPSPSPAPQK